MSDLPTICITILAHNEQRRISDCLHSLPLGEPGIAIHVVVNGSSDNTTNIARHVASQTSNVEVHTYKEGGKSRSWNRFTMDELPEFSDIHIYVDGDAILKAGSIPALVKSLADNPQAIAAGGVPLSGRQRHMYQQGMAIEGGLFGDLYALRGIFLSRMKAAAIRLPDDLIGDDGLIAALARTNLTNEDDNRPDRVKTCTDAGFAFETVGLLDLASWRMQYRRMINYSVRHFQNQMIIPIMRGPGPTALPRLMADIYPLHLPHMSPRKGIIGHFDRLALKKMHAANPNINARSQTHTSHH